MLGALSSGGSRFLSVECSKSAAGKSENCVNLLETPLAPSGIYFLDLTFKPFGRIEFCDFSTRSITPIFTVEKPVPHFDGLTLSPDAESLLFGQSEVDEFYLMLVKNFR